MFKRDHLVLQRHCRVRSVWGWLNQWKAVPTCYFKAKNLLVSQGIFVQIPNNYCDIINPYKALTFRINNKRISKDFSKKPSWSHQNNRALKLIIIYISYRRQHYCVIATIWYLQLLWEFFCEHGRLAVVRYVHYHVKKSRLKTWEHS